MIVAAEGIDDDLADVVAFAKAGEMRAFADEDRFLLLGDNDAVGGVGAGDDKRAC